MPPAPPSPQPIDQLFRHGPIRSIKVSVDQSQAGKSASIPVGYEQGRFEQARHLISRPIKRYGKPGQ